MRIVVSKICYSVIIYLNNKFILTKDETNFNIAFLCISSIGKQNALDIQNNKIRRVFFSIISFLNRKRSQNELIFIKPFLYNLGLSISGTYLPIYKFYLSVYNTCNITRHLIWCHLEVLWLWHLIYTSTTHLIISFEAAIF